jgi:predicted RNA-binding Zn ribbon-like protein
MERPNLGLDRFATGMHSAMAEPRPSELALVGGALALDFCNTVAWRTSARPIDRLGTYKGWLAWSAHADSVPAELAQVLKAAAQRRPSEAAAAFARVDALRGRIAAIFDSLASGAAPDISHVDTCRLAYLEALAAARLRVEPGAATLEWPTTVVFDRPLWPVLHSAWSLLLRPRQPQIHLCEGPGCGWLFIDRTRNSNRRWCSSNDCGRRDRVRRHRSRHAAVSAE